MAEPYSAERGQMMAMCRLFNALHQDFMTHTRPLVLLVEDEPLIRELLSELLAELGASVIELETADAGIEYLSTSPGTFDLIITDVMMPGRFSGLDLANLASQRWPTIPILVTSGYPGADRFELGANVGFLSKPWDYQTLESTIMAYLPDQDLGPASRSALR